MDSIGPGLFSGLKNVINLQVRFPNRCRPYTDSLVSELDMKCFSIGFAKNSNGAVAKGFSTE